MNIPSLQQADAMLHEAARLNPAPWVEHSRVVAQADGAIAASITDLDPQAACILGLLHAIGRRTKEDFERTAGSSIYQLLLGVVENTFGF